MEPVTAPPTTPVTDKPISPQEKRAVDEATFKIALSDLSFRRPDCRGCATYNHRYIAEEMDRRTLWPNLVVETGTLHLPSVLVANYRCFLQTQAEMNVIQPKQLVAPKKWGCSALPSDLVIFTGANDLMNIGMENSERVHVSESGLVGVELRDFFIATTVLEDYRLSNCVIDSCLSKGSFLDH